MLRKVRAFAAHGVVHALYVRTADKTVRDVFQKVATAGKGQCGPIEEGARSAADAHLAFGSEFRSDIDRPTRSAASSGGVLGASSPEARGWTCPGSPRFRVEPVPTCSRPSSRPRTATGGGGAPRGARGSECARGGKAGRADAVRRILDCLAAPTGCRADARLDPPRAAAGRPVAGGGQRRAGSGPPGRPRHAACSGTDQVQLRDDAPRASGRRARRHLAAVEPSVRPPPDRGRSRWRTPVHHPATGVRAAAPVDQDSRRSARSRCDSRRRRARELGDPSRFMTPTASASLSPTEAVCSLRGGRSAGPRPPC